MSYPMEGNEMEATAHTPLAVKARQIFQDQMKKLDHKKALNGAKLVLACY